MLKKLRFLLIVSLLFSSAVVSAQKGAGSPKIIIESGLEVFGIKPVDRPYIRDDYPAQGSRSGGIGGTFLTVFAGVKTEWMTQSERFGFSAGLRYTLLGSTIGKRSFPYHDYFYFLHRESGTTTEYLTIRMLYEESHYIGIPLEVRFYPAADRNARWYFNAGGELARRVATNLEANFRSASMMIFNENVAEIVGSANDWYTWIYIGGGVRAGRDRQWTFGLNIPVILSENASSLNTPRPAIGLHLQYAIPTRNYENQ